MNNGSTKIARLHSELPQVVLQAVEVFKVHPKVISALYGQPLYGTVIVSDSFGAVQRSYEFGDSAANTNSVYGRGLERIYRLTYNKDMVLAREGEDTDRFAAGVRFDKFLIAVSGPSAHICEMLCYRIAASLGLISREMVYELLQKFPNPFVTLSKKPDSRDLVLFVD